MRSLPRLLGGDRIGGISLLVALAVGQAAAAGVTAFATRDVFAALSNSGASLPAISLGLMTAAGALIALLRVIERKVGEGVGQAYAADVRKLLFMHLAALPAREVARRRAGGLALRFVGDLAAVRAWVTFGFARMLSGAIVLPGAFLALALLNPTLALAAVFPLLFCVVLMALFAPTLRPLHRRLRTERARLASDMSERAPVAPELKLLGRHEQEGERLDRRSRALRLAAEARAKASALLRAGPEVGLTLAGVLVLWAAFRGGVSSSEAAGALATLSILAIPIRDAAGIWDRHRAWEVARDKCNVILSLPRLEENAKACPDADSAGADLRFENVGNETLSDICACAEPGEKIAIVGANGTGKSTLLRLAAGLEYAKSGQVSVAGIDIRSVSSAARSRLLFYVGPRSPILKGSLRRALVLGVAPRPDDSVIEQTAREFGLGPLIARLGGLDGRVSEGGRNLSSGEVRRVHLVRARLADPRVLLLDEPDDAMDQQGRVLIETLVRSTAATTLLVTHDPSLAVKMDRLWMVDDGRLWINPEPRGESAESGPASPYGNNVRAA